MNMLGLEVCLKLRDIFKMGFLNDCKIACNINQGIHTTLVLQEVTYDHTTQDVY